MYREENPKASSSFDELPEYARLIYREAAAAALERDLAGGDLGEESKD